jgi:Putative Actinobacterial Holin-X, holin superfamily III
MTQSAQASGTSATAAGASAGDLVQQLSEQVSRLVRDELKLATTEMTRKGKGAAVGIGIFGGSGIVALFGLGCLLLAAIAALALVMPAWAAALIVGAVLLAVAGVAALAGKRQLSRATPPVPEQAVQSLKADVETIKESAHR